MDWAKIMFVGQNAPTAFEAFRAAVVQIWMPVSEDDRIALYAANTDVSPITVYLSPKAAELVGQKMPDVRLEPCGRPPADTWKSVGSFMASDPAWCELSDEERSFYRAEHETTWLDDEEAFGIGESEFEVLGTFPSAA